MPLLLLFRYCLIRVRALLKSNAHFYLSNLSFISYFYFLAGLSEFIKKIICALIGHMLLLGRIVKNIHIVWNVIGE